MIILKPLFLPLTSEVYGWYSLGKEWEVRPCKKRYNERSVFKGRLVNVSRGYTFDRWLGVIDLDPLTGSLEHMLSNVSYEKIVPVADSEIEAKAKILSLTDFGRYIAFHIKKL